MNELRFLALFLLMMLLGCPPDSHHYIGCTHACGSRGVQQITYGTCICNQAEPDGG